MGAVAGVGNAVKRDQVGLSWIFRQLPVDVRPFNRSPGVVFAPEHQQRLLNFGQQFRGFWSWRGRDNRGKHFLGRGLAGGGVDHINQLVGDGLAVAVDLLEGTANARFAAHLAEHEGTPGIRN